MGYEEILTLQQRGSEEKSCPLSEVELNHVCKKLNELRELSHS